MLVETTIRDNAPILNHCYQHTENVGPNKGRTAKLRTRAGDKEERTKGSEQRENKHVCTLNRITRSTNRLQSSLCPLDLLSSHRIRSTVTLALVHESRNRMAKENDRWYTCTQSAGRSRRSAKNGNRHRSNLASLRDKAPETNIALRGNFRERGRGGPTGRYKKMKTAPVTCNCDSIKSVNHRPRFVLRFGN